MAFKNKFPTTVLLVFTAWILTGISCSSTSTENHYLFSYFTGNGENGLHLAHSTDGTNWEAINDGEPLLEPKVGEDQLMRDPSVVQGPDGTFHMVWTVSWGEKGIGYAYSEDLINWSEQQYIPVMEHEPDALNSWAPELFYDEVQEEFIIVWATTIPGRFPETDGQDGDQYNHRLYYTKTKDFNSFSDTELFYDKGFNVIDGAIFHTGDQYAMLLKDETNEPFPPQKNIRLAFADKVEGPWSEPTEPITGDYWAEGPTVLNIDGRWYVYFDKYRQGSFGVLVSDDLEEWEERSDKLEMPEGIRHGTTFKVSGEVAEKLLELE